MCIAPPGQVEKGRRSTPKQNALLLSIIACLTQQSETAAAQSVIPHQLTGQQKPVLPATIKAVTLVLLLAIDKSPHGIKHIHKLS